MKNKNIFLVGLAMFWASAVHAMESKVATESKVAAKAVGMNAATKALFNNDKVSKEKAKKILAAACRIKREYRVKKQYPGIFLKQALIACLFQFNADVIAAMLKDSKTHGINPLAVNEQGESPLYTVQWGNDSTLAFAQVKLLVALGVPVTTRAAGGEHKGCTILEVWKLKSRSFAALGFKERSAEYEARIQAVRQAVEKRNKGKKCGTLVRAWYKIDKLPTEQELDAACAMIEEHRQKYAAEVAARYRDKAL